MLVMFRSMPGSLEAPCKCWKNETNITGGGIFYELKYKEEWGIEMGVGCYFRQSVPRRPL